ncbi:MAG: hypothetical protein E7443_00230 [Ruminococcaceae bacterium]|nr:hypothetical protein [Oscillospiraceae bacterium]
MFWLWILGILIVLLFLLCLTRVGIQARWHGGSLVLDAKIGLLCFHILPRKKESGKPTGKKKKTPKKTIAKPTFTDIRDAFRALAPPLKRALRRTGRGVRIHPLRVSLTLGGQEDPAAAGQRYGQLQAWLWTLMPEAEQLLDIPDPRIHIGLDFDAAETTTEAEAGISIRIGTLLAVAFGMGIPALRWLIRYQNKERKTATVQEAVRT